MGCLLVDYRLDDPFFYQKVKLKKLLERLEVFGCAIFERKATALIILMKTLRGDVAAGAGYVVSTPSCVQMRARVRLNTPSESQI